MMVGGYNPLVAMLLKRGLIQLPGMSNEGMGMGMGGGVGMGSGMLGPGGWQGAATPGIAGPINAPPDLDPTGADLSPSPPSSTRRPLWSRFTPETFQGEDVPEGVGKEAFSRAALMMGLRLLEAAPTGNVAAIPRAFGESVGTRDAYIAEGLERRREAAKDDLDRRRVEEWITSSQQARTLAQEDQTWEREKNKRLTMLWGREDEDRAGGLRSAEALVAQIQSLLPDSPEAARAEALLFAGPTALAEIRALHTFALDRSRRDEEFERETELGIGRDRARIQSGVEADPRVWQDIQLQNATRSRGGSDRFTITPQQYNDDLRTEYNATYKRLTDQAEAAIEAWEAQGGSLDFEEYEEFVRNNPRPTIDFAQIDEEARRIAEERVRGAYQGAPGFVRSSGAGEGAGTGASSPAAPQPGDAGAEAQVRSLAAGRPQVEAVIEQMREQGKSWSEILAMVEEARRAGAGSAGLGPGAGGR